MEKEKEFLLLRDRRWNNEDIKLVATGTENELFKWILNNTPFSNSEALTNQGYHMILIAF